jgi:spore coat polysaccharide biosynthesis protein SpsF
MNIEKNRRLVAVLACRNNGTRLYGKPMQLLYDEKSILDQLIESLQRFKIIDEVVLAIAEGKANAVFTDVAEKHGIAYIVGDHDDVLLRLITAAEHAGATDVFRITTECPWVDYALIQPAWESHIKSNNDMTVTDQLPEGLAFEIYTLASLRTFHEKGNARDRSEYCSNYPRTHPDEFKVEVILPSEELRRLDLRVTVDNPEDLILCRAIAKELKSKMPLPSAREIIDFLDSRDDLRTLVASYVVPEPLWDFKKVKV